MTAGRAPVAMPEDPPDPPRKFYGLKPRDFEAVNGPPRAPAPGEIPAGPDPGVAAAAAGPIEIHALTAAAAGNQPVLGSNAPVNRPNEVHALLALNLRHDQTAGHYALKPGEDRQKKRRVQIYWAMLVLVDLPLGLFAWSIGPRYAIPFVCAIGGFGFFTAWWTWKTWALRTD